LANSSAIRIKLSEYIAIHAVPSAWLMKPTRGQGSASVEYSYIIQAEKSALEDISALRHLCGLPTR
jgi:hypothetical protein